MVSRANFNVDTSNFTIRKPSIKPWQLILVGAFIALILVSSSHASSIMTRDLVGVMVSVIIVAFLYLMQKYIYDEKTASEYQCLIFSASMRANTFLSLILNRDGSIYYLDNRYTMNFPQAKSTHNFDQLLATIEVPEIQQNHIFEAMNAVKSLEMVYSNNGQQLRIGVYPISRPQGFFSFSLMPA